MSFTLDTRQLSRAFREVEKATGKAEADILNRAGRNICLRAIKNTPKADGTKIRALDPKILVAGAVKRMAGQRALRPDFDRLVRKELSRRLRSVGYIKAGWIMAAKAFGGAQNGKVSKKSLAGQGYGKAATEGHLVAILANCARGADVVGNAAFQAAVDFVAKDMVAYAEKKLAETWKKHSA